MTTIGNYYRIKCGWGWTKAKLEYTLNLDNGKTKYGWVTPTGFRFCSYDLEDTRELTVRE